MRNDVNSLMIIRATWLNRLSLRLLKHLVFKIKSLVLYFEFLWCSNKSIRFAPPWFEIFAPPLIRNICAPWFEIFAPPWFEIFAPLWFEIFGRYAAERVKMSFLRRPWSHDLGSTLTQNRPASSQRQTGRAKTPRVKPVASKRFASLRPWIRRFTMDICAGWLSTSSKFSGQEFEEIHRNIESLKTSKSVRIPPTTK